MMPDAFRKLTVEALLISHLISMLGSLRKLLKARWTSRKYQLKLILCWASWQACRWEPSHFHYRSVYDG